VLNDNDLKVLQPLYAWRQIRVNELANLHDACWWLEFWNRQS